MFKSLKSFIKVEALFLAWLSTIFVFFISLLGISNSSSPTYSFWALVMLGDVALGSLIFLPFIWIVLKNLRRNYPYAIFSAVIVIVLIGSLFLEGSFQTSQTQSQPQSSQQNEIECFVDGKSIKATREVCQQLSEQKPQQQVPRIIQMRPTTQLKPVEIKPPPKMEPSFTRCEPTYGGGIRCYKSWF